MVPGGLSREGYIRKTWVDAVPFVVDAHNHIGRCPGAEQTGLESVAKMDTTDVDRSMIFPFVEGNFTNDAVKAAIEACLDRLIVYCAVNRWQADAVAEFCRSVCEWGSRDLKLQEILNLV
jgi:hypothetical protein